MSFASLNFCALDSPSTANEATMSAFIRIGVLGLLSTIGVLLNAGWATAQFHGGWGWGGNHFSTRGFAPIPRNYFGGLPPVMPVRPLTPVNSFNPLMFNPLNPRTSPQILTSTLYYGLNRNYGAIYSAPSPFGGYSPAQPTYGGYMSGGAIQRDFGRAQVEAGERVAVARNALADQAAYERRQAAQLERKADRPLAPAGNDAADIASGAALNRILTAAIAADRGDKVNSAFLPPNLLANVRFTGGDAGDALNLIRVAGHLPFPKPFESAPLAEYQPKLEKEFAAATGPIAAGKPRDAAAVAGLEATVKKARAAMNAAEKTFDFDEATSVRRFMNQLDSAVTVLKKPDGATILPARWSTEGTSVAELVRHMAKFKMQFGPAPKEGEESYFALHRGLADYLIALIDRAAPAKKP